MSDEEINAVFPAYPTPDGYVGFTKREAIAMHMQASLIDHNSNTYRMDKINSAKEAVEYADALLEALEKK